MIMVEIILVATAAFLGIMIPILFMIQRLYNNIISTKNQIEEKMHLLDSSMSVIASRIEILDHKLNTAKEISANFENIQKELSLHDLHTISTTIESLKKHGNEINFELEVIKGDIEYIKQTSI